MSLPEKPANEIEFHFQLYSNPATRLQPKPLPESLRKSCGRAIPRLSLGISKSNLFREGTARRRNVYEEIYDRAGDPESRDPGAGAIAGSRGQVQRSTAPAWTGHSVAGILCCRRQDVLCVSGQR